jgi:hypothetical protein
LPALRQRRWPVNGEFGIQQRQERGSIAPLDRLEHASNRLHIYIAVLGRV